MTQPILTASPLYSVTLNPHDVLWLLKSTFTMCDRCMWASAERGNCSFGGLYTE